MLHRPPATRPPVGTTRRATAARRTPGTRRHPATARHGPHRARTPTTRSGNRRSSPTSASYLRSPCSLRVRSVARPREEHLCDTDRTLAKAAFAVGEVELPHADEPFVETQCPHLRQAVQEA